jgi:hypothetical protein
MPSRKPPWDEESSMRAYERLRIGHPSSGWEVIEALEDMEDIGR